MTRITKLEPVESIKPGEPPDVAPDGTILNPEPYHGCDVTFDDGIEVQIERPLTLVALRVAYETKVTNPVEEVDGVHEGDVLPPVP